LISQTEIFVEAFLVSGKKKAFFEPKIGQEEVLAVFFRA
jgi:hypothetical protein